MHRLAMTGFKVSSALLCLVAASCGASSAGPSATTGAAAGMAAPEITAAAQSLNDRAAQDCPWPADLAQYEQTTLIARNRLTPTPSVGVFDTFKSGCATLKFSLDDAGNVTGARVVGEAPPGFGAVAEKVLRWNDYAVGASSLTVFMVRVAGEALPTGGAMTSLGFKDWVINLEVPP